MAPTRALSDKYFLCYDFLKIEIIHNFLLFFTWFLLLGGGVILSFYEYQKFERPGEFTEGLRHEIIVDLPK